MRRLDLERVEALVERLSDFFTGYSYAEMMSAIEILKMNLLMRSIQTAMRQETMKKGDLDEDQKRGLDEERTED